MTAALPDLASHRALAPLVLELATDRGLALALPDRALVLVDRALALADRALVLVGVLAGAADGKACRSPIDKSSRVGLAPYAVVDARGLGM